MDPIASFQGLATGINFRDLVDQIIAAESRPIGLMAVKVSDFDRRTTAWNDFKTRVQTVYDRAAELSSDSFFKTYLTTIGGSGLSATASSAATEGSYSVQVLQLATKEKAGSAVYQSNTTALGLTGEFTVGGRGVSVSATDNLGDLAASINAVNTGSNASGVRASILGAPGGGYRVILTAAATGSAGIDLADGSAGVLRSVGFLDSTTSIKNQTSDGAKSDSFISATSAVGTLQGLTSAPPAAAVTIGALSVTIDLATQSLTDIATAINAAATGAGSSISAQVVSETTASGATVRRLDISGTTAFADSGGILETLGVLQAGRSAVAQEVQGAAFTAGDAVTAATGSTLLTDIWSNGVDAGVQAGDTLTFNGKRGDGSTFTKTVAVGAGSTYQDVVDSLNSASDAFGSGTRTATASISAGAVVVTDGTGGDSQLSLSIISHNEGGGTLDFATFSTVTAGRLREITAGVDAEVGVDGAFFSRSSNTVNDVVDGLTMTLTEAGGAAATVGVARDVDAIVTKIDAFMKAYNTVAEFVDSQFTGAGAEEGQQSRPLSGDGVVRSMRQQLRAALQTVVPSTITDVARLSEIGIELSRSGTYTVDTTVLRDAVVSDPLGVERFFSAYGAGSTGSISYVSAGKEAASGSYDIDITTLGAQATVTGTGFGGSYVDDATADTLSVTNAGTGSVYSVALTNGMSLAEIVDSLNTQFQTATIRQLAATNGLFSDALGTAATDATLLQDLFDSGGTGLGVADDDVITISGVRDDGASFFRDWTISDVTTQTLGDLRAEISTALGAEVAVDVVGGVITATAVADGRKTFTVSVASNNAGGGTFDVGTVAAVEEGRGKASITASDASGQLSLLHGDYGASSGFTIALVAGGADGTASLGVAAGAVVGTDVVGTIGGQAAVGVGRTLTGAVGSAAESLVVQYTGTATGAVGNLTFSRGIASAMELASDFLLGTGAGSVQGILDGLDTQKQGLEDRITAFEERLDLRTTFLIKQFTALEQAMALAQQQLSWLQAQFAALSQQKS